MSDMKIEEDVASSQAFTTQPSAEDASVPQKEQPQNPAHGALNTGGIGPSFRAAFSGIGRTVASQRNMKVHVLSALMVMIVGMALPFEISTRAALFFAVGLVLFAEILNTGLEALVDLFVGQFHRLAMLAKDAAAGGVLVLSLCAVLIFADIVVTNWIMVQSNLEDVFRSIMYGLPLVISEAVGLFVWRRGFRTICRTIFSVCCLVPLVVHAKDPIFSLVAFGLIVLTTWARWSFPATIGRGASSLKTGQNGGRYVAER